MQARSSAILKQLEICYKRYNRRDFLQTDPVQVLYRFSEPKEREIAALVASSLSYGRVKSILSSVESLLARFHNRPHEFILNASRSRLWNACAGFRHRFTGPGDMFRLVAGTRKLLSEYGTVGGFVEKECGGDVQTYSGVMKSLAEKIGGKPEGIPHLLPSPAGGSACKRMCLFFRWMIREDCIDPGGWSSLNPRHLILPLDVHMMRTCRKLRLTERKNPDWNAAVELTEVFRRFSPEDPVKYDFALTRASMFDDPILNHIRDAVN